MSFFVFILNSFRANCEFISTLSKIKIIQIEIGYLGLKEMKMNLNIRFVSFIPSKFPKYPKLWVISPNFPGLYSYIKIPFFFSSSHRIS